MSTMEPHPTASLDALLPSEMAEKAERIGADKTRLDKLSLLALAILAGAFIAFGALLSTVVVSGDATLLPYGTVRLLAGIAFSLGLILVIVGGAELFTGNNLMIMACAARKVAPTEVLRAWTLVYVGNLVGAVGIAIVVYLAELHHLGDGAIGAAALTVAHTKAALPEAQALFRGFLANILVCLAVWLCYSARTTTDRILAIVPPITAFVAAGLEHSVANMYLLPFGLLVKNGASESFWTVIGHAPSKFAGLTLRAIAANIVLVTIGNLMGGLLVGITYWFIYLRKRAESR